MANRAVPYRDANRPVRVGAVGGSGLQCCLGQAGQIAFASASSNRFTTCRLLPRLMRAPRHGPFRQRQTLSG